MNLTDKHPAELSFHKMITEVRSLLEKCENQYLDSDDRDTLREASSGLNARDNLLTPSLLPQSNRGKVQNLPK